MSIILESADGRDLQVNAWNWGVLHHVVARAGLFSEEAWEPKRPSSSNARLPAVAECISRAVGRFVPCLPVQQGQEIVFPVRAMAAAEVPHSPFAHSASSGCHG